MDAQLKRGMIEACVLAMLTGGDSYGYALIQQMRPVLEVSESTLYPVLRRLEGTGCVTVYSVEHAGRLRRYYAITEAGRKRLSDFETDWRQVAKAYDFIVENSHPAQSSD